MTSPSEASARVLREKYGVPGEQIRVVPWGVDLEQFQPGDRDRPERNCLLYVGPHERRKGLRYLLRALILLRDQGIDVRLRTVGKGSELPELRRLAREWALADRVEFLGYVAESTEGGLQSLYREADIFVSPSLREGFGLTLLEAMASGLPIVASDVSSIPEVVGEAGILVPPRDVIALARAIRTLVESPSQRDEFRRKGRARAETHFSWDQTVKRLLRVYEEALDRP